MVWRDRSVGKGSLIYADGRLYLYGEDGTIGLADAGTRGAYRERGRFSIDDVDEQSRPGRIPIITNGKLIIRDQDNVYAYAVKSGQVTKDESDCESAQATRRLRGAPAGRTELA